MTLPETVIAEPILAPPGAGIPWYQRAFLNFYVKPFVIPRTGWDENWAFFAALNNKILKMTESLNDEQLTRRVLVQPIAGLEDSSRYWSLAMTMEHLVIVGSAICRFVPMLSRGEAVPGKSDTASVKPKGLQTGKEAVEAFKDFVANARQSIESHVTLPIDRRTKYDHPWMGPLDAAQWQWLLGGHTVVHYRQAKQIRVGLY